MIIFADNIENDEKKDMANNPFQFLKPKRSFCHVEFYVLIAVQLKISQNYVCIKDANVI